MLKDIVKYLNEKDVDAEVWLVSDDYQTGVRAETVMELLDHTYFKANKKLVYNIIDVSSTWYSYYIQNKYYRGNEYLYENLSRLSGGNFAKMYDKYYMYYIDDALDCWAPKVSTVEIDPIPNNGFTYSRVNLSNRNNFHIGARYFQIGMFEGDLPINVNYFGNYLKNPYFNSIDLPEDYTEVPESITLNTALYWFGNYIMKDLFLQPQSYSTIKYIEELSVQNRLLTPYSAFVIPGPTGYSGYVRIYEDEITNIEEINQSEDEEVIPTELAISSYPNPFNPSTNIIMSIPANLANQEKQFDIYNILGEKVKSFDMTQYNNLSEIHINWSGMNDYGNAVASGMYIAVFKVGSIIKSLKLLLVQ